MMNYILVVDDQASVLKSVTNMFERKGQTVIKATNAEKASALFSQNIARIYAIVIDLRLTDNTIGDRGGFELACRFRLYNKEVPIFIYSASDIDENIKNDTRINGTFLKGAAKEEKIQPDEVINSAEAYWKDFHTDDPKAYLDIMKKYNIEEEFFLKLLEPKTPTRHERIVDLLLGNSSFSKFSSNDTNTGSFSNIEKIDFEFRDADDNLKRMTARVTNLENTGESNGAEVKNFKSLFTSLPSVFAYGDSREEALKNLKKLAHILYGELTHTKEIKTDQVKNANGTDFLRLKNFFNRAV